MANVLKKHSISSELAQKMVDETVAKARELSVTENVAILDDGGNLKAFSRMDGAPILCIEMAQNKAYQSGDRCRDCGVDVGGRAHAAARPDRAVADFAHRFHRAGFILVNHRYPAPLPDASRLLIASPIPLAARSPERACRSYLVASAPPQCCGGTAAQTPGLTPIFSAISWFHENPPLSFQCRSWP